MEKLLTFLSFLILNFYSYSQNCNEIKFKFDDMTGRKETTTPLLSKDEMHINPLSFKKVTVDSVTTYLVTLYVIGSVYLLNPDDVIILFNDGTKISKENRINVNVKGYSYSYNSTITLDENEIKLLSEKPIKKIRVRYFDETIDPSFANNFLANVKCVLAAK